MSRVALAPGHAREYETIYILRPNIDKQAAGDVATRVADAVNGVSRMNSKLQAQATQYYVANPGLEGDSLRIRNEFAQLDEINQRIRGFEQKKAELTEQFIAKATAGQVGGEGGMLSRIGQLQNRIAEQEITVSQTEAQIRALDQRLRTYDSKLRGIPSQRIERRRLEQRLAQEEEFYATIVRELQQTIIKEESELGYVQQVRSAFVPTRPVSPNFRQNVILGILLGMGFGVGLAFLRHTMVDRLRAPEDLQNRGYSLVGVIPQMDREIKAAFKGADTIEVEGRQLSTRLMPLLNPWSPISENYRLVRTNLQHSLKGHAPQVILVTSPGPADGKTLTAVNLAITMAQDGRRTLLIDADMRRPSAHTLLGVEMGTGLADMLDSEGETPDCVVPTHMDRLHFLAAGRMKTLPAEALGSSRMANILERYRHEYEVIIVDSPPVLAVSDPLLLATKSDATLLVISARRTDTRAIEVAERMLGAVGVSISGVIFNRFDERGQGEYGYDYRYGYEPVAR